MADALMQERFAKLIGHTFRLKISILVLVLVALFVVWSALTSGRQKADEVDKEFCQQIAKDPYYSTLGLFSSSCEVITSVQSTIQTARHLHDGDFSDTSNKTPEKLREMLYVSMAHTQQFQEYEDRRREAYRINLSLPYTKAVFLDGVLVSDLWPFCALLAVYAALALSFKQSCYEIHLAALIQSVETKGTRARDFALAEFLPGSTSEVRLSGRPFFLYTKPIGLSPETLASRSLFIVVTLLSLSLLTDYSPQFTERGEEVFSGYYFWLYLFSVFWFYLLLKSRRQWRTSLSDVLGGDVSSPKIFTLRRWLSAALHHASIRGIRYETIVVVLCVALAVGGFCSHWDESTRGYQAFWQLRENLSDAPIAARCLQLVLIAVFSFLVVSLFSILLNRARFSRLSDFIRKARYIGAVFTLTMVGFFVFSGLLTAYAGFLNWYLRPMLVDFSYASFLNSQNLEIFPSDMPLGYWVFLASCGLLALITVAVKEHGAAHAEASVT